MNSSPKKVTRTLALLPRKTAGARLLVAIANLPNDIESGVRRLESNFPYVLKDLPARVVPMYAEFPEEGESYLHYARPKDDESKYKYLVLPLRQRLRGLWLARDRYRKLMALMRISQDFFCQGEKRLRKDPLHNELDSQLDRRPRTRTETLLLRFIDLADYTRRCEALDCPAPYFVASRRSQKYCSPECARESQREFKRRWWRENGVSWRQSRGRNHPKK